MDSPAPTHLQPAPDANASPAPDLRAEFVEAYGAQVFLGLSIVGTLALLPFSVNNFLHGRPLLGSATAIVAFCLLANAVSIARGRGFVIPTVFTLVPALAALLLATYEQGLIGILWCFPAILLFHFVLPRRTANLFNVTLVLLAVPTAWMHLGPEITARVGVTLVATVLFTNIFTSIADAQRRKEAGQRQRLDLLVRGTNAGTLERDVGGGPDQFSQRLKQMLGLPEDEPATGWNFFDFVHPEDRERVQAVAGEQMRARGPAHSVIHLPPDDYRLVRAAGGILWVHTEAIAVTGPGGRTRRHITSFMDTSGQVQAQEELLRSHEQVQQQARLLEAQNLRLREAIRMREEVERIARHDLKTPLASIASVPRMLRQAREPGAREDELLVMVENAAMRVLSMVNLSLDLYRMEEGTYRMRPQPVDLGGIVHTVVRELQGHADSKHLRLELDLPAATLHARAEELLCYSIVANLLKNAVEASPDAHPVTIGLEHQPRGGVGGLSLRIHNAGVVPEAIRANFFEKYATHGKPGGTGLGAFSARLMARVQQGELQMRTDEVDGTTLLLWLPLWRAEVDGEAAARPGRTRHEPTLAPGMATPALSLLLVDDDPYNVLVLQSMLPVPPVRVQVAVNGRAAVDAVRESRPDLILLDLEMPVMGGLEAIVHIRRLQQERGQRPSRVVAFSARDDDASRERCLAAGFDDYLVKPARRGEVLAALAGVPVQQAAPPPLAFEEEVPRPDRHALALMPKFVSSRREMLRQLADAARNGQREEVRTTAHTLAGSFGMFGFDVAGQMSRDIELASASQDVNVLCSRIEELSRRFERDQARVSGEQPA